jgi:hypothetical protein
MSRTKEKRGYKTTPEGSSTDDSSSSSSQDSSLTTAIVGPQDRVAVEDPDATDDETPAAVDRSFGHDGEMDISIGNGSVGDTCDEANNSMVCNFNDSISRDVPTDEHLALSHPVTR